MQDDALQELLAEQRRTNRLLERIADSQPRRKRPWLCEEGKRGTCGGPWYACLLAGCMIRNRVR